MTQRTQGHSSRPARIWFALATAAGIPVGMLWWTLAPGGLNLMTRNPALAAGTNPEVWLLRDLTLAGLFVLAGCLVGVFLADKTRRNGQKDLLFALAGGLVGAVVAWQAGIFASQIWGAPADSALNASVAFSLRSMSVLLLWPAATAVAVFAVSLLNLLKQKPYPDDDGYEDRDRDSPPFAGSKATDA
ncbi:hypothetical protein [Arthrobacter sp. CDRTa11]|uniref:hypothetical protein n=1 Tax=Arthrobacter sp. CDRTa11 TaxID=2651199 RepID=UPI002265A3B3|nr:hypothetical protein [Arthrobacter sp. CDRTa11]